MTNECSVVKTLSIWIQNPTDINKLPERKYIGTNSKPKNAMDRNTDIKRQEIH